MRILLLASGFAAQYRVMRCAAALGAEMHVLGCGGARSLALSRYCRSFRTFAFESADPLQAAGQLDRIAQEIGAERILPADLTATQFLAEVRPHLRSATFPLSGPEIIERLGAKDRFQELCRELGMPHPQGAMYASKAELLEALARREIALPAMVKPVNRAGGLGVQQMTGANAAQVAAQIDYEPILVQQFIPGLDRCITIFARQGVVTRQVVYEHPDGVFRFLRDAELEALAAKFAAMLKLTGVFNFDARIEPDGRIWLIECNPRFYFNMDVAMVLGVNFAEWNENASGDSTLAGESVRIPNAMLRRLARLRFPTANDLKLLAHWIKDPLVFGLVALGYASRWQFPFLEKLAVQGKAG